MTSPGGVITGDNILLDTWLDDVTGNTDACHVDACSKEAVYGLVHTIHCDHLTNPLPFCLPHHDGTDKDIKKLPGECMNDMSCIYCVDCHSSGKYVRWEPWK